jgi:hypothetical protein
MPSGEEKTILRSIKLLNYLIIKIRFIVGWMDNIEIFFIYNVEMLSGFYCGVGLEIS